MAADSDDDIICDRHGEKQELDEKKLYASIYHPARECEYSEQEAEEMAEEVSDAVIDWIRDHKHDVVTSKEIREKTEELLEEKDEGVAFMYKTHLDVN